MSEQTESTENVENEEKAEKREVERHLLPVFYAGRCKGVEKVDYLSSMVSYGGKLPKGETLHKYEMRLPIPAGAEGLDTEELFGIKPADFIRKGLMKLMTDLDEGFKKTLFKGITDPTDAGYVELETHVKAQQELDAWKYKPRGASGSAKSVKVTTFIDQMVSTGRVTRDDLEGVETVADLFKRMSELGVQF